MFEFVCPNCCADEKYGFQCYKKEDEDFGFTIGDDGGSHKIGEIVTYSWTCNNCGTNGDICFKPLPQKVSYDDAEICLLEGRFEVIKRFEKLESLGLVKDSKIIDGLDKYIKDALKERWIK
jgi:hypothetical protein